MHPTSGITAVQVLWTLSFAALLVLLVVLLGRERSKRFKVFTISIVLLTFRLLVSKLLFGKMATIEFYEFFIPLTLLSALVDFAVLVELARKAFVGLGRRAWMIGTLVSLAVGAAVLATWGPWPAWKTVSAATTMAALGLMQTASQKTELLTSVVAVELGVLVLLFGRRFTAAWRSHPQAIAIGLSTSAIAQLLRDGIFELIVTKSPPHTRPEYDHLIGIRENLAKANEVVFLLVVIWWIATLWFDEPGTVSGTPAAIPVEPEEPALVADAPLEFPEPGTE